MSEPNFTYILRAIERVEHAAWLIEIGHLESAVGELRGMAKRELALHLVEQGWLPYEDAAELTALPQHEWSEYVWSRYREQHPLPTP
jgi:hypothetical protein